ALGLAVEHHVLRQKAVRERRAAGEHRPKPLLVRGGQAFEEIEVEHGPVKAADTAAYGDGLMDGGDVAESDDGARTVAERVEVDAVEDAHGAVAAAGAEAGVDLVRPQVMVELCDALIVGAGEVAEVAMIDVCRDG